MTRVRAPHTPDLSIGKLSRLTGVNIETVRYYERIGMLPRPRRTASGRRIYGAAEARTLAFIRRARELGFALASRPRLRCRAMAFLLLNSMLQTSSSRGVTSDARRAHR